MRSISPEILTTSNSTIWTSKYRVAKGALALRVNKNFFGSEEVVLMMSANRRQTRFGYPQAPSPHQHRRRHHILVHVVRLPEIPIRIAHHRSDRPAVRLL